MKKKEIILSVAILLIICVFGYRNYLSFKKENIEYPTKLITPKIEKVEQSEKKQHKKNNKIDKTEVAFNKFELLYNELLNFKNTDNFKKYGFGQGGENTVWLKKVREFKKNPDSKLLLQKGVLIGELEQLGMSYASSNGEETEVTKTFNEIFSGVISSNTEMKNAETQKNIVSEQITTENWYEGGNLHKENGTDWKRATEHNRLATCADFIITITKRNGETISVFSSEFKNESESLKNCIDEFYKLSRSENIKITKAVISCITN